MSILILQDPANFIFFPLIKYLHRKGKIPLLFSQKMSGGVEAPL
jgi:hypothetical protein